MGESLATLQNSPSKFQCLELHFFLFRCIEYVPFILHLNLNFLILNPRIKSYEKFPIL